MSVCGVRMWLSSSSAETVMRRISENAANSLDKTERARKEQEVGLLPTFGEFEAPNRLRERANYRHSEFRFEAEG